MYMVISPSFSQLFLNQQLLEKKQMERVIVVPRHQKSLLNGFQSIVSFCLSCCFPCLQKHLHLEGHFSGDLPGALTRLNSLNLFFRSASHSSGHSSSQKHLATPVVQDVPITGNLDVCGLDMRTQMPYAYLSAVPAREQNATLKETHTHTRAHAHTH